MQDKVIAVYIRLSNADEDTGRKKKESNSVVNQRKLIHSFLDNHPELSALTRVEFVDDGYTGTNTDRPSFQEMIRQIRDGRIHICITKDFSRFSRDYIEMGDYMECVFPFLNVRYISVNDGYDSDDYIGDTGGIGVVMRMIVYDAYSKDLSIKGKTGRHQNMKKGRRTCGLPGYGYKRDPERKAMDIIDPDAAVVVRRIFDEAISGKKASEIAVGLNADGVMTPAEYFCMKNPETRKFRNQPDKKRWTYSTVYNILRRYTYTGASVGGIKEQIVPCKRSVRKKKFEDWIIVPGKHEAIITEEEYELAQKAIGPSYFTSSVSHTYPLKSLMFCANCKRHLGLRPPKKYYVCPFGKNDGEESCKKVRTPRMEELEQVVYEQICDHVSDLEKKNPDIAGAKKVRVSKRTKKGVSSEKRMNVLKNKKLQLYEQYAEGVIDKETYLKKKEGIDLNMDNIARESGEDRTEHLEDLSVTKVYSSGLKGAIDLFHASEGLTYDLAHAMIEKIYYRHDGDIEIIWRY